MKNTTTHFRPSAELRDALLPKLLSGELRVKDVKSAKSKETVAQS
jgi:hypothetical protein